MNEDRPRLRQRRLPIERAVGKQQAVVRADDEWPQALATRPSSARQFLVNRVAVHGCATRSADLSGYLGRQRQNDERGHERLQEGMPRTIGPARFARTPVLARKAACYTVLVVAG